MHLHIPYICTSPNLLNLPMYSTIPRIISSICYKIRITWTKNHLPYINNKKSLTTLTTCDWAR